jgi:hypothetical protein
VPAVVCGRLVTKRAVATKLALAWPDQVDRSTAVSVLGALKAARGIPYIRVALAVIRLAEADLEKLRELTAQALTDYRDVLMWAEYPRESRTVYPLATTLSKGDRAALAEVRASDRAAYRAWLDAR